MLLPAVVIHLPEDTTTSRATPGSPWSEGRLRGSERESEGQKDSGRRREPVSSGPKRLRREGQRKPGEIKNAAKSQSEGNGEGKGEGKAETPCGSGSSSWRGRRGSPRGLEAASRERGSRQRPMGSGERGAAPFHPFGTLPTQVVIGVDGSGLLWGPGVGGRQDTTGRGGPSSGLPVLAADRDHKRRRAESPHQEGRPGLSSTPLPSRLWQDRKWRVDPARDQRTQGSGPGRGGLDEELRRSVRSQWRLPVAAHSGTSWPLRQERRRSPRRRRRKRR